MLNRPPSFVNSNSFVSLMSLGHHSTSPKLTARWSGGVSFGSTERLQPPRCRRDHASSEEEKERVSQLLAGTEKGQEVDVKTLAGTACLSHSAAGTVCADRVQFPHSPRPPLARLFMWSLSFSCDGSFKVLSGGCRCCLIRGAVVM